MTASCLLGLLTTSWNNMHTQEGSIYSRTHTCTNVLEHSIRFFTHARGHPVSCLAHVILGTSLVLAFQVSSVGFANAGFGAIFCQKPLPYL